MGFAMTLCPVSEMFASEAEAVQFRAVLDGFGIRYDERIPSAEYSSCPILDVSTDPEHPWIKQKEVGWSWWRHVQGLVAQTLSSSTTLAVHEVFAWQSVAVPANLPGQLVGPPTRRIRPIEPQGQVSRDEHVSYQMDLMVYLNGGPYESPTIGSAPRILEELESCAQALGLRAHPDELEGEIEGRYAKEDGSGDVATLYLLMCVHFFRIAREGNLLVWLFK